MIEFKIVELTAEFIDSTGTPLRRVQQVRTDPFSLKQCRITLSRSLENERGTENLFQPPESDLDESKCPFCPGNRDIMTPCLNPRISEQRRLIRNNSILFPNLFPYTEWSAVSLFDDSHHVEIGSASLSSYQDSFINCSDYLTRVYKADPHAVFMSITQNHLPGAGGSLIHPHLQVHATKQATNNHKILKERAKEYEEKHNGCIVAALLEKERKNGERYIGSTGAWNWITAFAPSGFYEIWGIAETESSLLIPHKQKIWQDLARGVLNTQKFYKSLNRNAYNLSLISIEDGRTNSCLKVSLTARSNYAPWVRSDFTGFDIASGEMATFTLPETVAEMARNFW